MTALWYVFKSKPQSEFFAEKQIRRQGFESWVPFIIVEKKRLGLVISQYKEALFPSYGFVRFDKELDNWKPLYSTFGVTTLVGLTLGHPSSLSDAEIESLRNHLYAVITSMDTDQIEEELLPPPIVVPKLPPIEKGETAKVMTGAFAGHEGICQYSSSKRTTLLIHALSITFNRSSLAKAGPDETHTAPQDNAAEEGGPRRVIASAGK